MEGFVAILICVAVAAGAIVTAQSMDRARKHLKKDLEIDKRAFVVVCLTEGFFALLGGFAVVAMLVLIAAWVVTWW